MEETVHSSSPDVDRRKGHATEGAGGVGGGGVGGGVGGGNGGGSGGAVGLSGSGTLPAAKEHHGLGAILQKKKASRLEKKERREQRKDLKKNPQFDFIEANESVPVKNKRDRKQKRKEDAAMFDFTEDNKHLKGQPKITRQMARAAKHGTSPTGSVPVSLSNSSGGIVLSQSPDAPAAASMAPFEMGGVNAGVETKKMTRVDLEDFLLRHPMHRLRGTTWNYMHISKPAIGTVVREKMIVLICGGVRGEAAFELLETLAEDFDVVALMLPRELSTFEDYVAGIDLVRVGLQIASPFHLAGLAMGGTLALHYASLYPGRLRSLVLSHTAPPDAEFGRLCERYAAKVHRADEKDMHMPAALSRTLLGHSVRSKDLARDVPQMLATEGTMSFWKKVLHRFALDSGSIQSKLEALAKHHLESVYTEKSFAELKCPVLLIETERSTAFERRSWEQLRKLLPMATAERLERYGALAVFVKGHEIGQTILKWATKAYFESNL